ncbi:MAG: DUF4012 domain-containing protein [Acidobacteria bacterium]|nr:DUF4012 domain-containing protein [Acidobacteriota bacterium]
MTRRLLIGLLAAATAVLAAAMAPQFTASPTADRLWVAGSVLLLVLAAARARPLALLWWAGLGVAATIGSPWILAAAFAAALALIALRSPDTLRVSGAPIAALVVAALLHPPESESVLIVGLLALIGAAPVLISARRDIDIARRRPVRIAAGILGGLLSVVVLGAMVLGLFTTPSLRRAVDASRDGIAATRAGDLEAAAEAFALADARYREAAGKIDSPVMSPARFLPVLGANIEAARAAIGAGGDLAASARTAVVAAPYDKVRLTGDGIDLDQITAMQAPVAALNLEVDAVQQDLSAIPRPWLLPPVASRIEDLTDRVDTVAPELQTASIALGALPDMLGATTPRTYLVEFTSESESRFLGGFVGSYSVLRADRGRLSLDRSESVGSLNRRLGPELTYVATPDFKNLYSRFNPQMFAQNWTVAPDLPSDVAMVEQLYAKATGERIDGVIVIDPFGLASLLRLTGPIRVDGIDTPLNADNAAEYLLHGQYLEFAGQTTQRRDVLAAVGDRAFDALLRSSRTNYRDIARALGPAASEGHLMFSVLDPTAQSFLDRLGLTGRFEYPVDAGLFSFRNSASFANKIDYFLHRSFTIDATVDPSRSRFEGDVTVELRNDSPAGGLPGYIIGNDNGEPTGTNGMYFSIYTSMRISDATLDGEPIELGPLTDRSLLVYSKGITIPPGGTRTLRFRLTGSIPLTASGLQLQLPHQPTVNDDLLRLSVRSTDPSTRLTGLTGLGDATVTDEGGTLRTSTTIDRNRTLDIGVSRRSR